MPGFVQRALAGPPPTALHPAFALLLALTRLGTGWPPKALTPSNPLTPKFKREGGMGASGPRTHAVGLTQRRQVPSLGRLERLVFGFFRSERPCAPPPPSPLPAVRASIGALLTFALRVVIRRTAPLLLAAQGEARKFAKTLPTGRGYCYNGVRCAARSPVPQNGVGQSVCLGICVVWPKHFARRLTVVRRVYRGQSVRFNPLLALRRSAALCGSDPLP